MSRGPAPRWCLVVPVKKLAGEEGSAFPPSTTTHDLRHHYASVLLAAGESVVAVASEPNPVDTP